jgi:predicted nuclease of predicted toxin-antitoxin system
LPCAPSKTPVTPSGRRLLVDECVPRQLLGSLTVHAPRTAQQMGWAGVKNGNLLELAATQFDVLFTVDKDFAGLADIVPSPIGVVILQVGSTDFDALLPHMAAVGDAISRVEKGRIVRVSGAGESAPG